MFLSRRFPRLAVPLAHLSVLIGFLGLAILFYLPIVLGMASFPDGDFTHHFLPFALFERKELLAGRLPLWNPYTYSGHPFLADIQAAVFYPVSLLLTLLTLPFGQVGTRLYLLEIEALLHLALAGWFTYLLVREFTGNRWAAWIAGGSFAFSGYLTGYPPLQLAILRSAVWLPLLLLLLERGLKPPFAWPWWIGAALVYATAFLAGHPQTFLHITYFAAAFGLWRIGIMWQSGRVAKEQRAPGTQPVRRVTFLIQIFLRTLVFVVLSVGLAAAQLLPSVEFTQLSVRADTSYAFVSGGFPLQDSWQLLLPGVLTQFSPLYIGVIDLGLALIAGGVWLATWKKGEGAKIEHVPFFAGMALVALLLAFGGNAFLYPLFFRFAPGWNLFRGQERAAFLVAFSLCILAGYGAAAIERLSLRQRRQSAVMYFLLLLSGVSWFAFLWQAPGHSAISVERYWLLVIFLLILTFCFVSLLWAAGWNERRQWLLLLVMLASLFGANFSTNLDQFSPARKTILAPEMEALGNAVEQGAPAVQNGPERVYNEYRMYEDYGMRQQIEDVWGSSPLRLAHYAHLFEDFPMERMWRMLGVGYVVSWRKELSVPSELLQTFPQATDTTYLHRLQQANPRLWLVDQWRTEEDSLTIENLKDPSFDIEGMGLVSVDVKVDSGHSTQGNSAIHSQSLAPTRRLVDLDSEHGGLLLVSENWMPGWKVVNLRCNSALAVCESATSPVGGVAPFSVLRANLTLIGIPVPPGAFQFELQYDPPLVKWGIGISIVTLTGLGLYLIWRILTHSR